MGDLESWHACAREPMNQRGQRAVPLPRNFQQFTVPPQPSPASNCPVASLSFESLEAPGFFALDVLSPEDLLQLSAAHLAPEPIDLVVGNRAELTLEFFRQVNAELRLEEIGHAALA